MEARLSSNVAFDYSLSQHLCKPLLARRCGTTGRPIIDIRKSNVTADYSNVNGSLEDSMKERSFFGERQTRRLLA